jgi:hypothetical protein
MAQLLVAIPEVYREDIADVDIGYANIKPLQLLDHMMTNYGKITPLDLERNMNKLGQPWDPETPVNTVFIRGSRCRKFATEGKEPIQDNTYIRALVKVFRASGVMEDAIKEWDKLKEDEQTVSALKAHFTNADRYRRETKHYMKDIMEAHAVSPSPTAGSPAPTEEVADAVTLTPISPAKPDKPETNLNWGYCWSHGVAKHTSKTCQRQKDGHIPWATMQNQQGGCRLFPGERDDNSTFARKRKANRRGEGRPPKK